MASDAFCDPELFSEFDKVRESSDRILMDKLTNDGSVDRKLNTHIRFMADGEDEVSSSGVPRFQLGSSDEDSEDSDLEPDSLEHPKSKPENNTQNHDAKQDEITDSIGFSIRVKLEQLKEENYRLKAHSRLIDPEIHCKHSCSSTEGPALQILYMNHPVARKYRQEIDMFIGSLVERERNLQMEEVKFRPNHVCLSSRAHEIVDPKEKQWQDTACTVIGCSQIYQQFVMDSMGWPLSDYTNPALNNGWAIPYYQQIFREALPCESDEEDDLKPQGPKRQKASCFNCGGDHNMKDCTEPKDYRRINENRKSFQNSMQNQASLSKSRYLQEDDPKFASFKPGIISDELREAMGLNPNQLPPYIYQMRYLGYPPGYLLHAEVLSSGLAMFDKHGKEVSVEGDPMEDGEVDTDAPPKVLYDIKKLVSFPGFNDPVPQGMIDEARSLGMPPLNPQHSKSSLCEMLKPKQYKSGTKRRHGEIGSSGGKRARLDASEGEDMDLDDSTLDSPAPMTQPDSHMSSQVSSQASSQAGSRATTPSLDDLEERQKALTAQLMAVETDTDSQTDDGDFVPPLPVGGSTPQRPPLPPGTPPSTPKGPSAHSTPLPTITPPSTAMFHTPGSGSSISMSFGTPLLQESKYKSESLPEASKWAEGITQHIPYENLPDATGTFDRMRRVLGDIRARVEKLDS